MILFNISYTLLYYLIISYYIIIFLKYVNFILNFKFSRRNKRNLNLLNLLGKNITKETLNLSRGLVSAESKTLRFYLKFKLLAFWLPCLRWRISHTTLRLGFAHIQALLRLFWGVFSVKNLATLPRGNSFKVARLVGSSSLGLCLLVGFFHIS